MLEVSPEIEKKLRKILSEHVEKKGNAISLLQKIEGEFGYIPEKAVDWFSKKLDIPESRFFGVITFYSQFHLKPRGKNVIQVCLGTACYAKSAENILNKIQSDLKINVDETTKDKKFSLEAVRCLGACGLAPVVVVGPDIHGAVKQKNVKKIIDKYNG
jgi:NADH:ubiquinone oxidoreductase subunit E